MNNKNKSLLSIVLLMGLTACNSDDSKGIDSTPAVTPPAPVPTLVAFIPMER